MDIVLGKGPLLGTCEKYYIYKRNTEVTALKKVTPRYLMDRVTSSLDDRHKTNYNTKKQARPHGFKAAWLTSEPRWKQTRMKANNTQETENIMASRYSVRTANVVQLKNTLAIHDETRRGRGTHSTLKKLDSEVKDVETHMSKERY